MPSNHRIGIDLGGTNFNVGLLAADGPDDTPARVLHRHGDRTPVDHGPEGVVRALAEGVRKVAEAAGITADNLAAVGIAAPGAVDHDRGIIIDAPNLRWNDTPLRDLLAEALGIPPDRVGVENDVNAALLGEHRAGAARGMRDAIGVWIGTGVGGAIILNNHLHRGATGSAGEIGQTILLPNATADTRIMEMVCSRHFVQDRIARLIRANRPSALTSLIEEAGESLDRYSAHTLAKACDANDPLATAIVHEAADLLAISIANTLTLLGITNVILGGGMTEALAEPYIQRIRDGIARHCFPSAIAKQLIVKPTALNANAGIIGAAAATMDDH
ncbi:MAG: ROK family protein [Phycisphaerales bacterium]